MPAINDDLDEDLDEDVDLQTTEVEDDLDEDEEPTVPAFTPADAARFGVEAALAAQRQQPQQFSQEEIDIRLQRFKVTEDHIKKIFDAEAPPAAKMAALQEMLDGAARHAVTSSQVLMQGALSPMQQQVAAFDAFQRDAKIKTLTKHVETKFPALAGKKKVITDAIQELLASGYAPPNGSKSAVQTAIAKLAGQKIRAVDPTFSLKGNAQRQASSIGTRRSSGPAPVQGSSGARSFLDHLH